MNDPPFNFANSAFASLHAEIPSLNSCDFFSKAAIAAAFFSSASLIAALT